MKSISLNRLAMSILFGAWLMCATLPVSGQGPQPWMYYETAEEAGFSSAKIAEAKATYEQMRSAAFMVIYKGKVLVAWDDVSRRYMTHSMRKSLMSAMYGIYEGKGIIDLNKSLATLGIDDKQGLTATEKQARVLDLITARSGIYHPASYEPRSMKANRPKRGTSKPGTQFNYNNWDFNTLLSILEQEAQIKFFDEFYNQIANPLGMEDLRDQDMRYRFEPDLSNHAAYLFKMSTRDLARFGQLYLDKGRWNGKQIVPKSWVAKSTAAFSDDLGPNFAKRGGYGYLWWVNRTTFGQPAYYASGLGGHKLYVLPEADMVIVHRVNSYLNVQERDTNIDQLVQLVLDAKTGKPKRKPQLKPLKVKGQKLSSVPVSEQVLNSYVGKYSHPFFREIEAYLYKGKLMVKGEILGTFSLFAQGDGRFIVEDLPELPLKFEKATNKNPKGSSVTLADERGRPNLFVMYY
ncbi:MAG: serine hydrolase [Roseivirga sp.]|nr:serine hydrolase [Roseivirga sp.]